jgi:hypothetical protein
VQDLLLQGDEFSGVGLTVLNVFCDLEKEIEVVLVKGLELFQVAAY